MRRDVIHFLLITCLASLVFFTNLGAAQLWDRDEPRNAGCAVEMLERGDLIVPVFNDELRHQKPILLYWLIAGTIQLFGFSEFSARLPSAVLAVGSVLATWGIGRRIAGPTIGFWSAIILSTSLMFDVAARAATPDSVLIFCNSMAILIYVMTVFAPYDGEARLRSKKVTFPKQILPVLAIYLMMGLGVLAKGPVGFVVPTAVIGLFCLITGAELTSKLDTEDVAARNSIVTRMFAATRLVAKWFRPSHVLSTIWSLRPITALVVVLTVAGPWYWLVDVRTEGDFTRLFFIGEHFGRATTVFENHRGGIWFYPLAILIGFFPWSVFWGPVAIDLKQQAGKGMSPATILLLCWVVVQVGLFSMVQTKLPSYVTPCYGALAILTAGCLVNWQRQSNSKVNDVWMFCAQIGLLVAGILITCGAVYVCISVLHGDSWIVLAGFIPILGAAGGLFFLRKQQRNKVLYSSAGVAVVFCIGLFGFATTTLNQHQQNRMLLDIVENAGVEYVASFGALESSWVVYGGKPVYELSMEMHLQGKAGTNGLDRPRDWQPKARLTPEHFAAVSPGAMYITTSEHVAQLKNRLPGDYQIIQTTDYFFRNQKLHLLARKRFVARQSGDSSTSDQKIY